MYVPLLVSDFLERAVKLYGDKPAILDDTCIRTYSEVGERANQLSNGLASLGVTKGDKVAYLAPNTPEMLEGFYGVAQIGAVMTPLNTRLKPFDYQFILEHSESKVLFVDYTLLRQVEEILPHLPDLQHVIVHGEREVGYEPYEEWLQQFPRECMMEPELDEQDIASLLYTSGTTGDPKGVLLSHRSNYLHALSAMHHLRVSDQDVLLHVLPMFHVNGWGSPYYYTANGASQVMLRQTDPDLILDKIEQYGVTVVHMAPTVLNMVLEAFERKERTITQQVRVVIAGSAPPPAFVRRVEEELGWTFIQVYGMTEISPLITISEPRSVDILKSNEERYVLKAKTGYDLIGTRVKVVDELGEEVPCDGNTVGEIITRTNHVMEGYYKNKEATQSTIQHGWLHTGDMATVDEKGYIEIVDRKKDVIISGGENISSIEVEGVLYDHPAILEAAVIAVPHEKWGESPHAVIVLRSGEALTEMELITFCRERLAHFKVPKGITFMNELPKTASGKIQKVLLRKSFWQDHERHVN
ncbi:AMP-dependent synthetase [Pontibacillus halophilus JSM 076056 = DSM 19796]|uniref:AMP-dependent synthetase n=1 Tax=Pontibacillus halophilus JSM 076056 = DSM 19796 TaxID=1385510 RepID=A0A0A5GLL6_9BACI|nr:long-chain-fatty-acid--CoA ligase [Pontibacillus halophilus]KGX92118.1 AMP-dependent synthetase [Pontibacillus halophilus JSM 076056 = DSM 19796]